MKRYDVALDIEADNLLESASTIWIVTAKVIGEDRFLSAHSPEELKRAIPHFNRVIIHNGFGFDLPVIRKLWGIPFNVEPDTWDGHPVEWIDTFHLSSYLNPDRLGGHSLDALSGGMKMDFRRACIEDGVIPSDAPQGAEFKVYSETMKRYNRMDCTALEHVYAKLMNEAKAQYGQEE